MLYRKKTIKVSRRQLSGKVEAISFYCELMKYNEVFMDRIQAAKSSKELLKNLARDGRRLILELVCQSELPEEAIKDFEVIGKDDEKGQQTAERLEKQGYDLRKAKNGLQRQKKIAGGIAG